MERRLFDDLVLSGSGGGGHTRAGAMPLSIAIHAAGLTALLALSMVVREDLPEPRGPIVQLPPGIRPAAVPGNPAPPRRTAPAKPRTANPTFDTPSALPEADVFAPDDAPIGDPDPETAGCIGCSPDGPGYRNGVFGDDPLGTASPATNAAPVPSYRLFKPPTKVRSVDPVYPPLARSAGIGGIVILECVIGRDGRVRSVKVLRGHPLLEAAASDAVQQWIYSPSLLNGVPVEVLMTVTVRFTTRH